jgi:hypothetical protein
MGHFVHHKVVSKPRHLRLPLTCRSDLLLEPEIKNVTQVDIGYDPPDFPLCGDPSSVRVTTAPIMKPAFSLSILRLAILSIQASAYRR